MAKDPVCGRKVTEGHAGGKSEYQERIYFFCSLTCKQRFEQNPQFYAAKTQRSIEKVRLLMSVG